MCCDLSGGITSGSGGDVIYVAENVWEHLKAGKPLEGHVYEKRESLGYLHGLPLFVTFGLPNGHWTLFRDGKLIQFGKFEELL